MPQKINPAVQSVLAEQAYGPIYSAQYRDAAKSARANEMARRLGLPADVVEADFPNMLAEDRLRKAVENAQSNTAYARMMANPRFAAAAIDDESIRPLATAVQQMRETTALTPTWASRVQSHGYLGAGVRSARDIFLSAGSRAGTAFAGLSQAVTEQAAPLFEPGGPAAGIAPWLPMLTTGLRAVTGQGVAERATEAGAKLGDQFRAAQEITTVDYNNRVANAAIRGLESVPQQVIGLVAAARGRPDIGLGIMAGMSGGESYREGREAGFDPLKSLNYAAGQAVFEAAGEKLPLFGFAADVAKGTGFGKMLGRQLLRENIGEQFTTHLQDFNRWATIDVNQGKTFGDYLAERPDAAIDTFIATTAAAGLQTSAAHGINRLIEKTFEREQERIAGRNVDKIMGAAANSSTRTANPSDFEEALAGLLDGAPGENLYFPAEKVRELFQSMEDLSQDPFWGEYAEQVAEAEVLGGDVVIPLARAATHLAGTQQWDTIRDYVRASPGGYSKSEIDEADAAFADAAQKASEEFAQLLEQDRAAMEPRQKLVESVRDKLMLAGFTPDAAMQYAELTAARYATRATRLGQEPTGVEADMLDIRGVTEAMVATGRVARPASVEAEPRSLEQPPVAVQEYATNRAIGEYAEENALDIIQVGKDYGQDTALAGEIDRRARAIVDQMVDISPAPPQEETDERRLEQTRDGGRRYSSGGLAPLEGAPDVEGGGPNADLVAVAEAYAAERGLPLGRQAVYAQVDEERARRIAEAYDEMEHAPWNPKVQEAYANLIEQTMAQYHALEAAGYRFWLYDDSNNPYANNNPWHAMRDLRATKSMGVFASEAGFGTRGEFDANDNPLLADTGLEWSYGSPDGPKKRVLANDVFRAVHDAFGHGIEGAGFRARGEENAWQAHARLFTGSALAALTTETRGQNSWLNFGPFGGQNRNAKVEDTVFADQKTGLMPAWTWQEGLVPDAERSLYQTLQSTPEPYRTQILEQGESRGRITFGNNRRTLIELFESRDLSTFIHETGHLFLEELRTDAMSPNATEQLKADWATVQAWFIANGHPIAGGEIPTEAHELWARGFERFAMEGKAPSSALRNAFQAFKRWMLTIYNVVDNLRSPVTPQIRDVMERLIATDEEIEAARKEQNIDALFTSAAAAGMTEAEFAAYRKAAEESRDEAHDALLARTMAAIRRERTKAWKDEAAIVRADATERADKQPVFRALQLLMRKADDGGMRISRQWIVDNLGEDVLGQLPKRVPEIVADDGAHPDDIAEHVGFGSGTEMVSALLGLEAAQRQLREAGDKRSVRRAQIDQAVTEEMRERHGDVLNDGTIEEEARALIHNDKQGEVIATEIRSLARRVGKRPTAYSVARRWAAERIAQSAVVEATSGAALQRYQRAVQRAAKKAEEAMLAGDLEETYRQKQAQMLNNALVSEAKKAKDKVDVAVARLNKVARRKAGSVDQAYLDQAHTLLEQVEMRPRSQRDINRQLSFEEWAKAQRAAGHDVVVPDSFAASLGTQHWSRLTVDNLLGLDDTVTQILHLGRLKQKLLDAKELRDYNEVIKEAVDAAGKLPPKTPPELADPSWGQRFKAGVANFDAALLKIETLVDWLDSKDPNGVFNRIIFHPIAEAQAREQDMFASYMARLNEALAAVPKKSLRKWSDRVTLPELVNRETGLPVSVNRHQLIAMALNMGNEGNAKRLADGYGWNEQGVLAVLDRELTAEEWTYVQTVWDTIEGLWPEIEAMERRVNGVVPERVQPRALQTSAGMLRGGYYPAVYDTARDYTAEGHAAQESDLFEAQYTRSTTRSSATKERVDQVKRPILLDMSVISRHLGEVIHDVTHREVVMNADKFLSDRRVMKAMDDALGQPARKQFRPWLKFIANQWALERAGNEGVGKFVNRLRANATVVGMGFRVTTIIMQAAGYSNSFEAVGARWVGPAVAQTLKNPVATFNFVMEKSGEIRHRMDTLDRDIANEVRRMAGQQNPLTNVKRFAFHGIGYMDRVVVIPTWIGAYNKALAAGQDEEQAIYAADKAVRQSQGSGAAKDMAAVARGQGQWGQALKLMTMFYSYLSAVYQRQRTLGRDIRRARTGDIPGLMARAWWLIVVPPLLSELLSGRGPDDDEDWALWSIKQMLFQSLGAIPMVRDAARPMWDALAGDRAFDYQLSPLQRTGQSLVNVGKDIHKVAEGEDTTRATRDVLEAAGYWTGLVPGQVAQATQFLVDVGYGEQDPDSFGDWYEGLTKGKIKED